MTTNYYVLERVRDGSLVPDECGSDYQDLCRRAHIGDAPLGGIGIAPDGKVRIYSENDLLRDFEPTVDDMREENRRARDRVTDWKIDAMREGA